MKTERIYLVGLPHPGSTIHVAGETRQLLVEPVYQLLERDGGQEQAVDLFLLDFTHLGLPLGKSHKYYLLFLRTGENEPRTTLTVLGCTGLLPCQGVQGVEGGEGGAESLRGKKAAGVEALLQ